MGYLQNRPLRQHATVSVEHPIWGEVHDGNAWFMGGVAGHAGLIFDCREVFKIALQFLPNYTRHI